MAEAIGKHIMLNNYPEGTKLTVTVEGVVVDGTLHVEGRGKTRRLPVVSVKADYCVHKIDNSKYLLDFNEDRSRGRFVHGDRVSVNEGIATVQGYDSYGYVCVSLDNDQEQPRYLPPSDVKLIPTEPVRKFKEGDIVLSKKDGILCVVNRYFGGLPEGFFQGRPDPGANSLFLEHVFTDVSWIRDM